MTAINLFKINNAAILLTDQAAMFGPQLMMVVSKVVAAPHLSLAVAVSGSITVLTRSIIKDWLAARATQAEAMGEIGELLRLVRDDVAANGAHSMPDPAKLFIALWHPELKRPECYVIDTAIVSVRHCDMPSSSLPFDPDRNALIRRIEDQRRQATNIGAAAELTTVTATGITSEIIHRWPDKLGHPTTL